MLDEQIRYTQQSSIKDLHTKCRDRWNRNPDQFTALKNDKQKRENKSVCLLFIVDTLK